MKYLNVPVSTEVKNSLDKFCQEKGMKKKKVVEIALKKFIEEQKINKT